MRHSLLLAIPLSLALTACGNSPRGSAKAHVAASEAELASARQANKKSAAEATGVKLKAEIQKQMSALTDLKYGQLNDTSTTSMMNSLPFVGRHNRTIAEQKQILGYAQAIHDLSAKMKEAGKQAGDYTMEAYGMKKLQQSEVVIPRLKKEIASAEATAKIGEAIKAAMDPSTNPTATYQSID